MYRSRIIGGVGVMGAGLALGAAVVAQNPPAKKPTQPPAATAPTAPAKPASVRPVPAPATQPIPPADKASLEKGLAELGAAIDELKKSLADKPELLARLPDVQIYHNAVRYPLQYNDPIDPKQGMAALSAGMERAKELKAGKHPWTEVSGPRGYVSNIDGSVQPYILSVPSIWKPGDKKPLPLALSCHGRDEKLTELRFISNKVGQGAAGNSTVGDPNTKFVAYLYGRFCCANKMAGEEDLFEVRYDVGRRHEIDDKRVMITGFSMGGGAVWHLAAHYGGRFVVSAPGAGFSESERFLRLAQNGEVPPWYESTLYHQYNATDVPENFLNGKTIAYAGEIDGQKQAGDVMEEAMAKVGLKLERFIGPKTAHAYEKETKKKMDMRVEELVQKGLDEAPAHVRFSTYTLRYPSMRWVDVVRLERHWVKATVDAEVTGPNSIRVSTRNVASLGLNGLSSGGLTFKGEGPVTLEIDGTTLRSVALNRAAEFFVKVDGKWTVAPPLSPPDASFPKPKGTALMGPIDDAFLSGFLIVKPIARGRNDSAAGWAAKEGDHAVTEWRRQFRGEARVKAAADVTDADIAAHNLVLFGTPETNPLIARVLPKLPIEWTKDKLVVNGQTFDAKRYVPVMIYPNPLNPTKYVVLNSGFTFREADYLNNARQTPKLPDYAVIDTQNPPTEQGWGKLPKAGFFGEKWEWQKDDGKIEP